MKKKFKKNDTFVSESEYTVDQKDKPQNIPPTGPMKGNPVFYGKEVGVKPTNKLKKKLEKDAHDITNHVVDESAEEDEHE